MVGRGLRTGAPQANIVADTATVRQEGRMRRVQAGSAVGGGRIAGGSSSQIFPQRLIPLPHKGACGNDDLYAQTVV